MFRACSLLFAVIMLAACSGEPADEATDELVTLPGERMYREGVLPNGEPMTWGVYVDGLQDGAVSGGGAQLVPIDLGEVVVCHRLLPSSCSRNRRNRSAQPTIMRASPD